MPDSAKNPMRPEEDDMVVAALQEHRQAEDIWLVDCPYCGWTSYYNEGTHASCRNKNCARDLTPQIDETYTLADYWSVAVYPCDQ